MDRKRHITGIQLHHHVSIDDAIRGLVNGTAGLRAALAATGDPDFDEFVSELILLIGKVRDKYTNSKEQFDSFYENDPEAFKRARDGSIPWPDETIGSFQARCTCYDQCLHRFGIDPGENGICNCPGVKPPCPAHPEK